MAKFNAKAADKKSIDLHGQHGQFNIESKKVKIRYFSTFAGGNNQIHDSLKLLEELKPMRERVRANQISNLDSLLQRDLNDYRVANELIPYLVEGKSPIAFFPAILAVLIPKGSIEQNEDTIYPMPQTGKSKNGFEEIKYEDNWSLEIFEIDDKPSSLGMLKIDTDKVDIIVLDGQHRANAFRVVTGTFNAQTIYYSTFYRDIKPLENFDANLPVTIIWFDNDKPTFDPKIISRRLFVDVNNNAKKVSQSRNILLDETEVASLMTRFFYSHLADKSKFRASEFSLFHSDFDLDSDISVSANNAFAITNPQVLYDIHSWITLGRTDRYTTLDKYEVGRETFRNSLIRFGEIFQETDFNSSKIQPDDEQSSWRRVVIKDVYQIEEFQKAYNEVLAVPIYNVFSKFNFFAAHFEACKQMDADYNATPSKMDHVQITMWEEVFMGGEGLYYTFKNKNLRKGPNSVIDKYTSAISSLEADLKNKRAALFSGVDVKKVNAAFDSANTKAFQIGLFMAFDFFREEESFVDSHETFIEAINCKSVNDWIYILTDIRRAIIVGTDPKKWPSYQKIILRAIQNENMWFYDSENFKDSPDYKVFSKAIEESLNGWIASKDFWDFQNLSIKTIGKPLTVKWIETAKADCIELFEKANISQIENIDYPELGQEILQNLISSLK